MAKDNKKEISVISSERDGLIVTVEFPDGRRYKLQHPGNRTWLEWRQAAVNLQTGAVDMIPLLDKGFEFCVVPIKHDFHPTIDTVKPAELEVWQILLLRFFGGELELPADGQAGFQSEALE